MMRRKFLLLGAVLAGIAMAGLAPPAQADFTLTVTDNISNEQVVFDWDHQTVTVTGTGSTNATTGTFASQLLGGLIVSQGAAPPGFSETISIVNLTLDGLSIFASASNSNTPGSPSIAQISMGGINISGLLSSNSTLTFNEQSTGFTSPTNPGGNVGVITSADILTFMGGVSATYTSQLNGADVAGSAVTVPPNGNSPSVVQVPSPSTPYTVGGVLSITLPAGSSVTDISTGTQVVVPEPSSIALIGCGALSLLGYSWRRRKVAVA